jgi:UPF0716 family protein affecting phage T7 exclusion
LALIWASGRRFLAGVLLIIPGPFSDFIALLLLLWPTSKSPRTVPVQPQRSSPGATGEGIDGDVIEGDVIEGDFRRED